MSAESARSENSSANRKSDRIERLGDRTALRVLVGNNMRAVNGNLPNHADMPANIAGQADVPQAAPEEPLGRDRRRQSGAHPHRDGHRSLRRLARRRDVGRAHGLVEGVGTDCVLRPVASSSAVTSPEPKSIAA